MATYESFTLGGTELNDTTNYAMESIDLGNPAKRPEWITGADADGAALVRDPLVENRTVTIRVRVAQQATMDLALAKIGALVDLLEEAERRPGGLACVWTPAGGTKSFTLYCLLGEVTGLPITPSGDDAGWFLKTPVLTLTLTCKPFGYGAEVTLSSVSSSTPVVTLTAASVTGDVPAEARLIVTDGAARNRSYVEWGLEQRYYDVATSLLLDSDSMTITGFAGSQSTRTGAYDPNATGSSVVTATLSTNPLAVCATGNLSHVGTFRIKARVYASSTSAQVRLSWREGAGPYRANTYQTAAFANNWCEVDLGLITIPPADLGTQRWDGRIEAYSATAGDTLDIDYLVLVPAGEGYGRARAALAPAVPGAATIRDDFAQSAGALSGKTLPVGGTWSGVGDADDFQVSGSGLLTRATTFDDAGGAGFSGRYAAAGTTTFTDVFARVDVKFSAAATCSLALLLRYTDRNNSAIAIVRPSTTAGVASLIFGTFVAGVQTTALATSIAVGLDEWVTLASSIDTMGRWYGWVSAPGADLGAPLMAQRDSVLATGGTLASGKVGLFDINADATAITRTYDNFYAGIPDIDAALYSGRAVEIRHDSAVRQDSTGTYYGPVSQYRGSRFLLPPAGSANRTSRLLVKAHRDDIETGVAANVTDSLTAQVKYTPRYSVIPR